MVSRLSLTHSGSGATASPEAASATAKTFGRCHRGDKGQNGRSALQLLTSFTLAPVPHTQMYRSRYVRDVGV